MARWGACSPDRLKELSPAGSDGRGDQRQRRRREIVFFSQPYELVPLHPGDLLSETLPALERACQATGARLVVKPHPLQTSRELAHWYRGRRLPPVDDKSPQEVLATARLAVVLDSSVVTDCRRAAVPCIGVGWFPGLYGKELEEMGYMVRARSPEHLEQLAVRFMESPVPPARG
jgi:hypothetical protein